MPRGNIFTLAQAAQILGMPEQQVLGFIESRQLIGEFNQGLMSYMIQQDHLLEFMKGRKMFQQMQKVMVSRVLLCDRDQQVCFLIRTELERSGKIQVKIATTAREVEMAIEQSLPDVVCMHIAATQRAKDSLADVLRKARQARPIRLIIYHNDPDVVVAEREDIKRLAEVLKCDALVSIAGGTRRLVVSIEEMLGIKREPGRTQIGYSATRVGSPTAPPGSTRPGPPTSPPGALPTQPPPANPPAPGRSTTRISKKGDTKVGETRRKTLPPPP